jgi:hypothetical protein
MTFGKANNLPLVVLVVPYCVRKRISPNDGYQAAGPASRATVAFLF